MRREEAKLRGWMLMGMLLVFMAAGITLTFFFGELNFAILSLLGVLMLSHLGPFDIVSKGLLAFLG